MTFISLLSRLPAAIGPWRVLGEYTSPSVRRQQTRYGRLFLYPIASVRTTRMAGCSACCQTVDETRWLTDTPATLPSVPLRNSQASTARRQHCPVATNALRQR